MMWNARVDAIWARAHGTGLPGSDGKIDGSHDGSVARMIGAASFLADGPGAVPELVAEAEVWLHRTPPLACQQSPPDGEVCWAVCPSRACLDLWGT